MTRNFVIKNKTFKAGAGEAKRPLICVPLLGQCKSSIESGLTRLMSMKMLPDAVEWRADYYKGSNILEISGMLAKKLVKLPIIFTFRSASEGGAQTIPDNIRASIYEKIIASETLDLVDIELETGFNSEIIQLARKHNRKVIISSHDFQKTPAENEILERLCKMQEIGADIAKIALTPQSPSDVLTLLNAGNKFSENYAEIPSIIISMGDIGKISRISGGFFGSCVTFGSLEKASAPGQIDANELSGIISAIYGL